MASKMKGGKFMRFVMYGLAVIAFVCLVLLMPFMGGAVDWVAGVFNTTGDKVRRVAKGAMLTAVGGGLLLLAITIGAAIPIVAVVVAAVAVAAIVYAWWPMLFDSDDTMPDETNISDEIEDQ